MSEQHVNERLKPCPSGHPASTPFENGQVWWLACRNVHCGWHTTGATREEVVKVWETRSPGPATKAMLNAALNIYVFQQTKNIKNELTPVLQAFINEWGDLQAFVNEWGDSGMKGEMKI